MAHKIKDIMKFIARKELGDKSNRPVTILDRSDKKPVMLGVSGRAGYRPGARRRSTWGRWGGGSSYYTPSTRHIEVGKNWLINKITSDYPKLVGHLFK